MAKYYVRWQLNPQLIPLNPEERNKLWSPLLKLVKEDIKAGKIKDWGAVAGETCGYAIREESSEAELHAANLKWIPYVSFEANPVLTCDQLVELTQKALAAAKAK
ncbi:MAG: hypothetical protein H6Q04_2969 [Acidobacteria bacterium]|nr:hypothetical protein [Acidobacteriota bacterium]